MQLAGLRIAAYCRYSTDRQNDRSIEDQLRLCREYVQRFGGALDDSLIFSDAALSGSGESMLRPGFQALHENVRKRRVDVVVIEDLTRIGRDIESNARTLRQFKSWGAQLLSVHDGVDLASDEALVNATLKSLMAQQYVTELRKRTKRGMDGLHIAGMHTGGRVYGYRTVPLGDGSTRKRQEIYEPEATIVRRIFAEFIAGSPQRVIAERLNRVGAESPRHGKWGHMTIRMMLRNEIYIGRVVFNRRRWERDHDSGKRRYVERPQSEWRTADRPELRIIDPHTWEAACLRTRSVADTYKHAARPKQGYSLSGLLVCGLCGEAMLINGGGRYYACGGRKKGHGCTNEMSLRERAVRGLIVDQIRDTAGAAAVLDRLRAEWASATGARERQMREELTERTTSLAKTEQQISKLLDLILDGRDSDSVQAKLREKEDHAELQRAAMARLASELGKPQVLPSIEEIRQYLQHLPEVVADLPDRARQMLARLIVGPVKCFPPAQRGGDYRLRFDLDPSALLNLTGPAPGVTGAGLSARGSCGGRILPLADVVPIDVLCPPNYMAQARSGGE